MASFGAIYRHLSSTYPAPLLVPAKPHSTPLISQIAALEVHPTLEAALHLLNNDLPSAHFLVRHMQSPPAFEGMFLHGVLHRIEGDFDNARCWYSDVAEHDLYGKIWGPNGKTFKELGEKIKDVRFSERVEYGYNGSREKDFDAGQKFLNAVQYYNETKASARDAKEEQRLLEDSKREFEAIVEWCVEKFGEGRWMDASSAWVKNSEEIQKMSDDQVSGNTGYRKF